MIAKNLAHQAVARGHQVRFTEASAMLSDLSAQDGPAALRRRLHRYIKPALRHPGRPRARLAGPRRCRSPSPAPDLATALIVAHPPPPDRCAATLGSRTSNRCPLARKGEQDRENEAVTGAAGAALDLDQRLQVDHTESDLVELEVHAPRSELIKAAPVVKTAEDIKRT